MGWNISGLWGTVVGTRGGLPKVYWPGVLNLSAVVVALTGLVLRLGWLGGGVKPPYFAGGWFLGCGYATITARIRYELRYPPDQLRRLDDRSREVRVSGGV